RRTVDVDRLAAQFGGALLDKAVADAALRAAGMDWVGGANAGVLGDPVTAKRRLQRAMQVALRHTVGLADRLTVDDEGHDPHDGLPATLEDAIARYGLRFFKLKLSGRFDADLDRLARIAAVLDRCAGDWRVTLDGNETFDSAESLGRFWHALSRQPILHKLLARTLLLEQPIARKVALTESIAGLGIGVPVILDESDDHDDALDEGIALGYRGISSKACKGIYRSLCNALRVAQEPQRLLLSGEDLTCQAGLAVQQDTLLAASLGVTHIERNGHHYVDGFGIAPDDEARAFAQAHPGFYAMQGSRVRLAVHDGRLDLRSLHAEGFAGGAMPHWNSLTPIH
ncbi:MAG TPA: mandelate racemase, partial [Albitalea sp.]